MTIIRKQTGSNEEFNCFFIIKQRKVILKKIKFEIITAKSVNFKLVF